MPVNHGRKKIIASIELIPNYIFHVMAVCRINFDSPYADTYRHSINSEDIAIMQSLASLLTFGGGEGGDLIDFVAVPMSSGINTGVELGEYYNRLNHSLGSRDYDSFIKYYRLDAEHFEPWYPMDPGDLDRVTKHRATLRAIGDIFTRNFDRYAETVWPEEKAKMQPVAVDIEGHFADKDVVGKWEELTGITFVRATFSAVMCSAIANGPNANSVAYDRVVFYHDTPRPKLLDFIVHEVGTHIMVEPFKPLWLGEPPNRRDLFHAYECLASFYTRRILGRPVNYDLKSCRQDFFDPRINELVTANPSMPIRDLITRLAESAT